MYVRHNLYKYFESHEKDSLQNFAESISVLTPVQKVTLRKQQILIHDSCKLDGIDEKVYMQKAPGLS